MADDPKTNETNTADEHVVLPVHVGDGEVQHIAFHASTPLPVVHKALLEHLAPPDIESPKSNWAPYTDPKVDPITGRPRPNYGPTREGVLENDPKFKAAAKAIYEASGRFQSSGESGTYLDENLERSPIASSHEEGHMTLRIPKTGVAATLHTHPNHFKGQLAGGQPSDTDIATAKKLNGPPVFVVSKSGLQSVDKFGKVTSVYSASDWYDRDNK